MQHLAGPAADGVDQDVDPAEPLERLGDHPVGVGLDGRIRGDREAVGAGRPDPLDREVRRLERPSGDRDMCPRAREGLRERRPDAAAATGDQGHPTLEAEDVELAQSVLLCASVDYRGRDGPVHDRATGPASAAVP